MTAAHWLIAATTLGLVVLTTAVVQSLVGEKGHTRSVGDLLVGGLLVAFVAGGRRLRRSRPAMSAHRTRLYQAPASGLWGWRCSCGEGQNGYMKRPYADVDAGTHVTDQSSVAVSSVAPAAGMAQSPDGAAAHREGAGPPVGSLPVPPDQTESSGRRS